MENKDKKLFCPACGRCIGESVVPEGEPEPDITKVLIQRPRKKRNTKHLIHSMCCPKCKQELYVSMEFVS